MSYKDALNLMRFRMQHNLPANHRAVREGVSLQQQRIIQDKLKTFDKAVLYSYQAAQIRKVNSKNIIRGLINPNKTKPNYDEKTLSVSYEYDFKPGEVFEWIGTHTYWLVYLQDLTELAYFRGNIRRCRYEISWNNGAEKTYAAISGPDEMSLDTITRHKIVMDVPNYSLHLLLPLNEKNLQQFQRYQKFYLSVNDENTPKDHTCWRVEAYDRYSTPGILEVFAKEYYANDDEDDIENGIVGGQIHPPKDPNANQEIRGLTFIKPKASYQYEVDAAYGKGSWKCENSRFPVKIEPDGSKAIVSWDSPYSGQFTLIFQTETTKLEKIIVVQSLF